MVIGGSEFPGSVNYNRLRGTVLFFWKSKNVNSQYPKTALDE